MTRRQDENYSHGECSEEPPKSNTSQTTCFELCKTQEIHRLRPMDITDNTPSCRLTLGSFLYAARRASIRETRENSLVQGW